MKPNPIAVAIASLLVGGAATAAFMHARAPDVAVTAPQPAPAAIVADVGDADAVVDDAPLKVANRLEYAEVVDVDPVTRSERRYATVLGTEPVRESETVSTPREVCEDVALQDRQPERDGNVGGTVAGAVIGGLIGSRVGDGDGRKAATVAGAAAGGYIGNRVDRRHEGGKIVTRTERQCRTVTDTSTRNRTVAWNVTYRNPDRSTGTLRTGRKPGERIPLGNEKTVVGYDVTYRYQGEQHTLRMDRKPGDRLPVIDGAVVAKVVEPGGGQG